MSGFTARYPNLAQWTDGWGWLELGADEMSDSLVRVLDEGELVWESSAKVTIDEALAKAEIYVSEYMKELGE
jgi:hypothetical protein